MLGVNPGFGLTSWGFGCWVFSKSAWTFSLLCEGLLLSPKFCLTFSALAAASRRLCNAAADIAAFPVLWRRIPDCSGTIRPELKNIVKKPHNISEVLFHLPACPAWFRRSTIGIERFLPLTNPIYNRTYARGRFRILVAQLRLLLLNLHRLWLWVI